MTARTPGPWFVVREDVNPEVVDLDDWHEIAKLYDDTLAEIPIGVRVGVRPGDPFADARLIAAAPELLDALRELLGQALAMDRRLIEVSGGLEDPAFVAICHRVDDAIAKATRVQVAT